MTVDVDLPDETTTWPGCVYPLIEHAVPAELANPDGEVAGGMITRHDVHALFREVIQCAAFLAIAVLLALILFRGCAPRPTFAAARVPLEFTSPDRAASYQARARRPDGVWLALTPFADSAGTVGASPATPGARQTLWVLISEDWRAGGWLLQLRACNSVGCAEWSNPVLAAAGIPDTTWTLERDPGGLPMADARPWKNAVRRVGWALTWGDTAGARVVHQETVQQRESARICELYGYWVLRGGRLVCP